MIRYALTCEAGHEFEAWFGASGDFDQQFAGGLLACPLCSSPQVSKQVMAPALARTDRKSAARTHSMIMEAMGRVRAHVEENFDYVGDRFAAEARDIHEGGAEARGIYGEASADEVRSLVEDGVPVSPLPPAARKKNEVN